LSLPYILSIPDHCIAARLVLQLRDQASGLLSSCLVFLTSPLLLLSTSPSLPRTGFRGHPPYLSSYRQPYSSNCFTPHHSLCPVYGLVNKTFTPSQLFCSVPDSFSIRKLSIQYCKTPPVLFFLHS